MGRKEEDNSKEELDDNWYKKEHKNIVFLN